MTTFAKPIIPAFMSIILLAGCGGSDKAAPPGGPGAGMPPPEVEVMTVAAGKATLTQDLPGRLQAYRTAQVRARVEGVVEKRLFQEGSEVKAGMPLFQIDARTYRANAEAARADLMISRQTVERYKPLQEIKAVSQQEYDLAVARHKQAEAALIRAEEALENASVPAAISGRIGRALVTEGALVGRGEATLLAAIEQIDPIHVNFTQPGADVLRLRQAIKNGKLKRADSSSVELLLEDGSIYPQTGKIFFTDMAVDPATGAVSLRAEFPNPQRELLPGMFVRLRFPQAQADHAIRVPQRAVQANPQGQFVMVVTPEGKGAPGAAGQGAPPAGIDPAQGCLPHASADGSTAVPNCVAMPQPVKTGGMAGSDFIITEGLKGGELVIVNGLQKARPGMVVVGKPLTPDPSPASGRGESSLR